MITTIRKIALCQKDDSNNGGDDTVVILTGINDGVDGSSVFGLTNEHESLTIEGGMNYTNSANPSLDVRVLKPTGNAYTGQTNLQQLKDWSNNKTDLYVTILTIDGAIFFGDYGSAEGLVKIVANEQLSDNDIFAFKITKKTNVGFNDTSGIHQNGFWFGNNLVGIQEWGDKDGSGVADGWIALQIDTTSFTNNIQTLTTDDFGLGSFYKNIFFPFEGETVNLSITFDSVSGTYATNSIVVRCKDASDATISPDARSGAATATRLDLDATVLPDTVYLQLKYEIIATSGSVTTTLSYPALRVDGKATYTKF